MLVLGFPCWSRVDNQQRSGLLGGAEDTQRGSLAAWRNGWMLSEATVLASFLQEHKYRVVALLVNFRTMVWTKGCSARHPVGLSLGKIGF